MTKEQYLKISKPLRENEKLSSFVRILNLTVTGVIYVSYPALMLFLLVTRSPLFLRCLLVPGIMFVSVSAVRKLINRKRPYEALGFTPVIEKDKRGESMPSRHVFSAFMIAMTFLYVCPWLSVVFFIFGLILSAVRIIGGVHYPSDIAAGALTGIIAGIIGFFVI